jgi:hypothetical protein
MLFRQLSSPSHAPPPLGVSVANRNSVPMATRDIQIEVAEIGGLCDFLNLESDSIESVKPNRAPRGRPGAILIFWRRAPRWGAVRQIKSGSVRAVCRSGATGDLCGFAGQARLIRTRTYGGVGGWGREAPPIPRADAWNQGFALRQFGWQDHSRSNPTTQNSTP